MHSTHSTHSRPSRGSNRCVLRTQWTPRSHRTTHTSSLMASLCFASFVCLGSVSPKILNISDCYFFSQINLEVYSRLMSLCNDLFAGLFSGQTVCALRASHTQLIARSITGSEHPNNGRPIGKHSNSLCAPLKPCASSAVLCSLVSVCEKSLKQLKQIICYSLLKLFSSLWATKLFE